MARYTMTIRELCSTFGEDEVKSWFSDCWDLSDYLDPQEVQVIKDRGVWSKEKLVQRIIDYYFLREIGTDAIGAFQLYVRQQMRETMETYAPLIYSASIKYDPLVNVDFTETFDRTSESKTNSDSSSSSNGSGLVVNSDTPQGQISKSNILNGTYASSTSANENTSSINDSSENTGSGSESYTRKTKGNSGVSATAQAMVRQYRDNIRALNSEIVYELAPLFMGLY